MTYSTILPTEPIGSIPRPQELLDGLARREAGELSAAELKALYREAVRDTCGVSKRAARRSSPMASGPSRASGLRRSDRPHRPPGGDVGGGADPRPRSGGVPAHRAPGHHRRLRFLPFDDDTSTARDTAFVKIQARVEGIALAARALGL